MQGQLICCLALILYKIGTRLKIRPAEPVSASILPIKTLKQVQGEDL
jgi:hypothetical protein